MTTVVHFLTSVPPLAAYVIVAVLAFSESAAFVGFVLPGETALLFGGVLAAQGTVSLPVMVILGIVAAIAGDSVGYLVGRRFGPRLRTTALGRRLGETRWERADSLLLRAGGRAVLLARFVTVVRALMPSLAGMARMPYRTFLTWNVIGGIAWGGGFVLLGYLASGSITTVERYLRLGWLPVAALVILLVLGHALRRHGRPVVAAIGRSMRRLQPRAFTAVIAGVTVAAVAAAIGEELVPGGLEPWTRVLVLLAGTSGALLIASLPPRSYPFVRLARRARSARP